MIKPRTPKFHSFIRNGRYAVGCTGQTVVLYEDEKEIARFKDLIYAYHAAFSPNGDMFAVKSADGRLAFYGVEPPRLIGRFRFSKINGAQDGGFCFSHDGKYFYNIECHKDSTVTALSVYRTDDLSLERRLFDDDERLCLCDIEFDVDSGDCVLLGFYRNSSDEGYRGDPDNEYRLMRFSDSGITQVTPITSERFDGLVREIEARRTGAV